MTRDKIFLAGESAFIFAVWIFPYFHLGLWLSCLAAGLMLSLVFLFPSERVRVPALIVFFFVIGFIRFGSVAAKVPDDASLLALGGKEARFECRIIEMPEFSGGKQRLILETGKSAPFRGKILAYVDAFAEHAYGDTVVFRGKLSVPENFDGFDYKGYLRGKGIYMLAYYPAIEKTRSRTGFYGRLYALRQTADRNIRQTMSSPAGNIVSAMTLGMDSEEIEEIMEKFNQTGTSHVIAVSGYHMVVVAAIIASALRLFGIGRLRRFNLVIFGILCFVILSGSQASAIRSGIMAAAFLFASQIGRGGDALRILIFSAFVMIFQNPYILAGDVGFQLSFLATFGLVALLPWLEKKCRKFPQLAGVKGILLTTLAAQIAVFPILILNFGQFSLLPPHNIPKL